MTPIELAEMIHAANEDVLVPWRTRVAEADHRIGVAEARLAEAEHVIRVGIEAANRFAQQHVHPTCHCAACISQEDWVERARAHLDGRPTGY
jgi:hypothetical protein